jgi:DNA-binding LacI/PurR family transcriptional regulator
MTSDPDESSSQSRAHALPRPRAATIYDVAELAGVSHQTVSRHLKGFAGIRPETRERVERALSALDYRPNLSARSLITGRSHRIGALTYEIDQVGPSRIVQGAAAAARRAGFVLDIVTLDAADEDGIAKSLEVVNQHDLAGVIVLASSDEMTAAFNRTVFRVPVYLSMDEDGLRGNGAGSLSAAIDEIVDHLYQLGHRRFFHLGGPANWVAAQHRHRDYTEALTRRGLESAGCWFGDWSAASGYAAIDMVPSDVTAIVSANDQMALGALLALDRAGRRVPEHVSVSGLDDVPEAAFYNPPLTTIHLDTVAQGGVALGRLLDRISPGEFPIPDSPPARVVLRSSTGPVRPRS